MARQARRRSRGGGTLFKRASGVFCYQWTDPNTGVKKTKSLRTKNRQEALAKIEEIDKVTSASDKAEVMVQIARQKKLVSAHDLPMADVWSEFMATNPTAGPGTLALYERAVNEFAGWLATERPSVASFAQVDLETATAYMESVWQSGVSASTYNDKRNALGHIAKKLANRFGIEFNPWPQTDRMKGVRQTRVPLTGEQVKALCERLEDPAGLPYPAETRALVHLCLFAGMRLTDAVHLRWSDVDLVAGVIRYTPAKTARTSGVVAQVPILPVLYDCLAVLPREEEQVLPAIVAHYDRNPDFIKLHVLGLIHEITGDGKQDAKAQCQRARSQYGIHSLRHTFASEAARLGAPGAVLSLMTGDTLQTLQRFYVKIQFRQEPVPGFEAILRMLRTAEKDDPARAQLRQLADELPLSAVQDVLRVIHSHQTLPVSRPH